MKNNKADYDRYLKQMNEFEKELEESDFDESVREKISDFQREEMREWLDDFDKNATCEYKDIIHDMMDYVINNSESGNSIIYLNDYFDDPEAGDEAFANKVNEVVMDELGDFMLDPAEVYEDNGTYIIDAIFGGFFVPNWDGWGEDWD